MSTHVYGIDVTATGPFQNYIFSSELLPLTDPHIKWAKCLFVQSK